MSAAGGGECAKRADRGQDDVGPAGPVGEVQDRAAAVAGEGRGDREQPVAEPFGFPPAGFVLGMGEQARPRGQVAGEGESAWECRRA